MILTQFVSNWPQWKTLQYQNPFATWSHICWRLVQLQGFSCALFLMESNMFWDIILAVRWSVEKVHQIQSQCIQYLEWTWQDTIPAYLEEVRFSFTWSGQMKVKFLRSKWWIVLECSLIPEIPIDAIVPIINRSLGSRLALWVRS